MVCITKNPSFSTDQYLEISDLIYLHQRQNFSGDLFGWIYNLFVEEHWVRVANLLRNFCMQICTITAGSLRMLQYMVSLSIWLKVLSSCNIFIGTILQYSAAMKNFTLAFLLHVPCNMVLCLYGPLVFSDCNPQFSNS